jgi:hypothetical protein
MCSVCVSRVSTNDSCTISMQHRAVSCSVALCSLRNAIQTQRSVRKCRTAVAPLGTGRAPCQRSSAWRFVGAAGFWGYWCMVREGCRPVALGTA